METKKISMVVGAAMLALTATASAGPMSVMSSQIITPPIQIEQIHYYWHHQQSGRFAQLHIYWPAINGAHWGFELIGCELLIQKAHDWSQFIIGTRTRKACRFARWFGLSASTGRRLSTIAALRPSAGLAHASG